MTTYFLIDGAMAYGAIQALPAFASTDATWFAALLPTEGLRLAGPLLVDPQLLKQVPKPVQTEANGIVHAFPHLLHVSIIDADIGFADLAAHLRWFTFFSDMSGQVYGLRIADCRVLSYLPRVLGESQWNALTSPMVRWRIHDRSGGQQPLALHDARSNSKTASAPCRLNPEQIEQLIDAGEADALLAVIGRPPETSRPADIQRDFDLASRCVERWRASGSNDRRQLIDLARRSFQKSRNT